MNKNLYIFGNGDMAEVVHYYFNNHSDFKIEAFVVDDEYFKDLSQSQSMTSSFSKNSVN